MAEILPRKLGVKFEPPALILTYSSAESGKSRRRTMPVRNISNISNLEEIFVELRTSKNNGRFIDALSKSVIIKMLAMIKDTKNGLSLEECLRKSKQMENIDPLEDLNKADDETLLRKKAAMEESFSRNQKKPGDEGFQYDIEVDFGANDALETMNWSDDDNEW